MSLLELTRGDDATRTVTVTLGGEAVSLETAQQVTFTAKRQVLDPDSDAVLRKDLDDGVEVAENVATITFVPEDTDELEAPALFPFDVEVIDADGLRATVAWGYVRLTPDVTREADAGS